MTRKDFDLIADVLNEMLQESEPHENVRMDTIIDVMVGLSNAIRDEYIRFDPERFRQFVIVGTVYDPTVWASAAVAPNAGSAS